MTNSDGLDRLLAMNVQAAQDDGDEIARLQAEVARIKSEYAAMLSEIALELATYHGLILHVNMGSDGLVQRRLATIRAQEDRT